ncbi:MAG TPA: uracil-DNA glycosylase [Verrucomicrobiae bacterium]|jgi:DNA polymerase
MSDYLRVLEGTEQHLRALKAAGVRFLSVNAAVLDSLSGPLVSANGHKEGINVSSLLSGVERTTESVQPNIPASEKIASDDGKNARLEIERSATSPKPPEPTAKEVEQSGKDIQSYDSMLGSNGMDGLRQRALSCLKCPHLVKSRKNVVFGVGDIHARLMFIGEAPGADEDAQGEPFVGAAGQLLTRIIQTMGLTRETVYIANILKCRPDTPGQSFGNRKPTPNEMKTCLPYLLAQIDLIRPSVIVALGATAVEGLLGKTEGISKLRGKFHTFREIPLMPTFHPSYLLRNQALTEKRKVWEDMLQVMQKLEMPISDKQKNFFLKQ